MFSIAESCQLLTGRKHYSRCNDTTSTASAGHEAAGKRNQLPALALFVVPSAVSGKVYPYNIVFVHVRLIPEFSGTAASALYYVCPAGLAQSQLAVMETSLRFHNC